MSARCPLRVCFEAATATRGMGFWKVARNRIIVNDILTPVSMRGMSASRRVLCVRVIGIGGAFQTEFNCFIWRRFISIIHCKWMWVYQLARNHWMVKQCRWFFGTQSAIRSIAEKNPRTDMDITPGKLLKMDLDWFVINQFWFDPSWWPQPSPGHREWENENGAVAARWFRCRGSAGAAALPRPWARQQDVDKFVSSTRSW